MKSMLKGLLAYVLGMAGIASAEAATVTNMTVRYEFDVVDARPFFFSNPVAFRSGGLFAQDSAGVYRAVLEGSQEYNTALNALHPLGFLNGQSFSAVLDLDFRNESQTPGSFEGFGRLTCVSGPICTSSMTFLGGYETSIFTDTDIFAPAVDLGPLFPEGTRLSSNQLSFNFDTFTGPTGAILNGTQYVWSGEFATFTLDNFTSRLLPVPLPASALLLGVGLIPLAALRRRKTRA